MRRLLLFCSLAVLLFAMPAQALVIDNGLAPPNPANVIDTLIDESVLVQSATTVELVDGGQVGDNGGERFEVFDVSNIIMSGGLVRDDIFAHGMSSVTMSGGIIQSGLLSYDTSTVIVTGGTVQAGADAGGSSALTVLGGTFARVGTFGLDGATVEIRGGDIHEVGQVQGFTTLTIFGSGFALDGSPVPFGAVIPIAGQLTGVLASGEPLDAIYSRETTATVLLAPIPEPSTAALMSLGMVALAVRRRGWGTA